jgi:hypothetical protein
MVLKCEYGVDYEFYLEIVFSVDDLITKSIWKIFL